MPNFVCTDWSVLPSLSSLSKLTSLRIIFHDMNISFDENICQIIAETASILVHFDICFRRQSDVITEPDDFNPPNVVEPFIWDMYNIEPDLVIGEDGNLGVGALRFQKSIIMNYQKSIEEIHRRIVSLSFCVKLLIVVEEGKCGLTVWF
ncbi:hypothetical protein I4U23_027676 [Adineta vaga]|nr:hypothetical protein I4U23_027676 [Adineta vaga]